MTAKQRAEFIKSLDFSFICPNCAYRVEPSEIVRTDDAHIRCPKCGKESVSRPEKGSERILT